MEKIKIEDLMSGKADLESVEITREYVPINEKMPVAEAIVDAAFQDGTYDMMTHLVFSEIILVTSYTNVEVEKFSNDIYDFLKLNSNIQDSLPMDELDYIHIIDRCVEERKYAESMDKAIKDSVNSLSNNVNRFLKSASATFNKMDANKFGENVGVALNTLASKLPDLSDIEKLDKVTGIIDRITSISKK